MGGKVTLIHACLFSISLLGGNPLCKSFWDDMVSKVSKWLES